MTRVSALAFSMMINDAHCHFFSTPFFAPLGGDSGDRDSSGGRRPGTAEALADRWVAELDRHRVSRAALIASVPGDAASVAAAVARHPRSLRRLLHGRSDAAGCRGDGGRRRSSVADARDLPLPRHAPLLDPGRARARGMFEVAAARPGTAVFVHCGVLSVGVRKKLGLPSPFDIRFGNPLDLHAIALALPDGADHHPALRRGPVSRSADARRSLSQRACSTRRARTAGSSISPG